MTPSQTARLLKILRANGVTHFKSHDLEIRIGALESQTAGTVVSPEPTIVDVPRGTGPTADAAMAMEAQAAVRENMQKYAVLGDVPIKEMKIPHQLTEMISLLKMTDEQLVDRLFPDGAPPPEQQGAN